jgi:hypothetical protein
LVGSTLLGGELLVEVGALGHPEDVLGHARVRAQRLVLLQECNNNNNNKNKNKNTRQTMRK